MRRTVFDNTDYGERARQFSSPSPSQSLAASYDPIKQSKSWNNGYEVGYTKGYDAGYAAARDRYISVTK